MVNTFAAGGTADVLTRLVAEQLSATYQAAVLRRDPRRRRRHDRRQVGRRLAARRLQLRAHQRLAAGAAADQQSEARLRRQARPDQHRPDRRLAADRAWSTHNGAKTLKEFVEQAADRDKPLTYSSSGVGSSGHLFGENLAHLAGIKFEHVPYKGASQGLTDLAGGHIVFSVQTVSSAAALVRGGTLRALAHTGKTRLPDFPDVPTFKELGYDMVAHPVVLDLRAGATCRRTSPRRSTPRSTARCQTPEVAGAAAAGRPDRRSDERRGVQQIHRRRDRGLEAGAGAR